MREDKWIKALDDWDLVVRAHENKKNIKKAAKENKAKDMKQINRAGESLHRKMSKKNVTIDVSDRPLTLWSSDTTRY